MKNARIDIQNQNSETHINEVWKLLIGKAVLADQIAQLGFTNTLRIGVNIYHDLFVDYIKYFAMLFTQERDKIGLSKMTTRIFGLSLGDFKWTEDLFDFKREFETIVDDEYFNQCKVFVQDNYKEMNLNNFYWILYWTRGPGLNKRTFDFSKIMSPTLRREVMLYFMERLRYETNFRDDRGIAAITTAMNYLVEHRSSIMVCADITKNDVVSLLKYLENDNVSQFNKDLTPNSIRKTIENCGSVVNHIIESSDGKHPLSYPIPQKNPFRDVEFHNIAKMEHNTDIIPDVVYEQLKKHEAELSITHQLICNILESSGMRIGEVINLEEDCIKYIDDYEAWALRYKVAKTMNERRKKSKSDYNIIVLPEEVAMLIMEQIDVTEELRLKYNIKNIFINNINSGHKHALTQGNAFCDALNRLAEEWQIVDIDGSLWHFTSRQYRKKVAVDLIENNATLHEIQMQFAHVDTRTGRKYYAEVRQARLAELNHKFFEKKFNLLLGENNLELFDEKERKVLYVDFCLNNREVELGVCTKHYSEGPCGKRSGKNNCATCKNLCTGMKYLPKWIRLRDSQKNVLNELIRIYEAECITNYSDYRDYQKQLFWYNVYEDIVRKIRA